MAALQGTITFKQMDCISAIAKYLHLDVTG